MFPSTYFSEELLWFQKDFHSLPQYLIVLLVKFKDLSTFPQLLLLLLGVLIVSF